MAGYVQAAAPKIPVGSHLWVEDPDEQWIDGDVVEVQGAELTVKCTNGKTVSRWQVYINYIYIYILNWVHGWLHAG